MATDDLAILCMTVKYRNSVTLPTATAPVWNGQSFTQIAAIDDHVGSDISMLIVYKLKAASSGTYAVTWGFNNYTILSAAVEIFSGVNTTTATETVSTQGQWSSSGWTAPSLNVTDSASGDLIVSILGSIGWDDGYSNLSGVVWTPATGQSAALFDQNNSAGGSAAFPRVLATTKAGASGTVNVAYTKNTGSPAYQQVAFALKAASAAATVDTIDNPITVGTAFNLTTTGLGTLTTASTIGGVPVTAASAPSGDGTLTYSFTNAVLGPLMGTVSVVAGDGTLTATATGKTLQTMTGYTSRVLASLDRSSTSLGSDPAINNGDEIHAPNLGGGTLAATGLFSNVPFGTYTGFWKRDATDGKMYTFDVTFAAVSGRKQISIGIGIGL